MLLLKKHKTNVFFPQKRPKNPNKIRKWDFSFRRPYQFLTHMFKAADLQNIQENQIFQNISSNTYISC